MAKKLLTLGLLLVFGLFMATSAFAWQAAQSQGGKPDNVYMEVQLNTGTAGTTSSYSPAHGMVMEWDVNSDTGETLGYTVHIADSADSELVAGIVPAWDDTSHNLRALPVDGDTFLIQVRGYHSGVCTTVAATTEGQSIENTATGLITDGDGLGVSLKGATANDSTNKECGYGGYYDKVWIDFDKGTN